MPKQIFLNCKIFRLPEYLLFDMLCNGKSLILILWFQHFTARLEPGRGFSHQSARHLPARRQELDGKDSLLTTPKCLVNQMYYISVHFLNTTVCSLLDLPYMFLQSVHNRPQATTVFANFCMHTLCSVKILCV